jgi:hypothetical protein
MEGPAGLPGYTLTAYGPNKVRLVKILGSGAWMVGTQTKKGVLISLAGGSKWKGWYLSYDITGKSKEVFLAKKPGPGSYWAVDTRNSSDCITANAGKLEGWHLTAGKAAGKLKDDKGKPFVAYRVVLAKNPKPLPVFTFVELSR